MSETELVRQLKQGDRQAFDRIYGLYCDKAMRTAFCLAGNRQDAEDIVQDTFVKVYQHIGELKNEDGFGSWFFRILTRTAWSYLKKARTELPDEEVGRKADESFLRETGMDFAGRLAEEEEAEQIRRRILELPEKHRTALVLYYYEELPLREIARIMGCLPGTVKSRLHTARRLLEKRLRAAQEKERRAMNEKEKIFRRTAHVD